MNIGFDAKRAFHNNTGLGNYSRTLILNLAQQFSANNYFLFNPKKKSNYTFNQKNIVEINPVHFLAKLFPSLWRSRWMASEIEKTVTIYHGLSNELPWSLVSSSVKKVVTIHDLIFERYPEQYNKLDVFFYKNKFKFACQTADKIIAISEATKQDILATYPKIEASKIEVCYQTCDERFFLNHEINNKESILATFNLPANYFIYVGSIIERKNLLTICKALKIVNEKEKTTLVVVGKGKEYKLQIKNYLHENEMENQVVFLEDQFPSNQIFDTLPYLYHFSKALIYPSIMEGFGIPVIEAMASKTAVITSNVSSLKEAGGEAAILINPLNVEELATAMSTIYFNESVRQNCIQKGNEHIKKFSATSTTKAVMNVYQQLIS